MINHSGAFQDANNQTVVPGDEVFYQFGFRHGIIKEILQDGDGFVLFTDTNKIEQVKWVRLCKASPGMKPPTKVMITKHVTCQSLEALELFLSEYAVGGRSVAARRLSVSAYRISNAISTLRFIGIEIASRKAARKTHCKHGHILSRNSQDKAFCRTCTKIHSRWSRAAYKGQFRDYAKPGELPS